jgi:hypothetical protein
MVYAVYLGCVFLIAHQAEQLAGTGTGYSTTFLGVMVFFGVFDGLIAYSIRRKKLFPALDRLRRDPIDAGALKEWRFSTNLSLVLTMSIALYGLVLRILGGSRLISWPFFVAALLLMLMWRPQLDLAREPSNTKSAQ